ncbi:hypothetical protein ABT160_17705 [Streptomyces sp. NPDC001941]|uniref:hypothetical protein n=1 Tax=Streptomyces sp. NPDC001941 TaxID=3154659 RepID=UPI00333478E1
MDKATYEIVSAVGWISAVQGGLGTAGRLWGEQPWGLLHKWWDIPTPGYVVLLAVGLAIALTAEAGRKRGAKAAPGAPGA